jgi:hypothetical protein
VKGNSPIDLVQQNGGGARLEIFSAVVVFTGFGLQNLITTPPEHRKLLCVESANCVLSQSASAKRTESLGLT